MKSDAYWTLPRYGPIRREVAMTFVLSILYNISFCMQMMLLPYIVKELSIHDADFGYLQTLFGVFQLIGGPLFGQLCDSWGTRNGLLVVHVSTIICCMMTFAASNFTMLAASRVACMFMHGQQAHQTLLSVITEPGQERTNAFGRMGLTFGAGFMLGPLVSAAVSRLGGTHAPLVVASLICVLCMFLVLVYIPSDIEYSRTAKDADEKKNKTSSFDMKAYKRVLQYPGVILLLVRKNLGVTPLFLSTSVFQVHLINAYGVSPGQNSLVSALIGASIMFMNGFGVVWLRARLSEQALLRLGAIDLVGTYLALALFYRLWHLFFIFPALALGMSLLGTVTDSQLTAIVPAEEQGTVLGFSHATNALTRTIAPAIAGLMLEKIGFASFGYLGVVCCLVALATMTDSREIRHKKID
uniref:Major facilitator superfamily (MFS) profile domain-containing protein n=1 Tax=Plectus sambesii TaxID=2011161 RepID=A0A914USR8_9BILA